MSSKSERDVPFQKLSGSQRDSLESQAMAYEMALRKAGRTGPAATHLEGRGITPQIAATFRLGYWHDPDHGTDWLTIPYITPTGVVNIKGRRLNNHHDDTGARQSKYITLSAPGMGAKLFNVLDLHLNVPRIVVCEGELDAMILSGVCGIPAVGLPGSNGWKPRFRPLFQHYDEVLIVMDNDEAGSQAGNRLLGQVGYASLGSVPLDYNDVNDFFLAEGRSAVRERLGFA